MKKAEREKLLTERLRANRKIELDEAMRLLGVSESTARRVFIELEQTGIALRTHGGLSLIGRGAEEYSFDSLLNARFDQKAAIGKLASMQIQDGDVLYVDCGTTLLALCRHIAQSLKDKKLKSIQLFTNSYANLEVIAPMMPVTLIGGLYRPNRKDFCGYVAESTLAKLHFSKSFLGADGCDLVKGFTATDFDTAKLNQIVLANSESAYVLCDSSKMAKPSLVSYAPLSSIEAIITDYELPPATSKALADSGTRLLVAPQGEE